MVRTCDMEYSTCLNIQPGKYTVQRVGVGAICHLTFDNLDSFMSYYRCVPHASRTFNEVVPEGPQKMRVDIDALTVKHEFMSVVASICVALHQLMPNSYMLIYNMSDDQKVSCHIVVCGVHLSSSLHCKYIHSLLLQNIHPDYREYIDASVYKSLQYFRMEGSTKIHTRRYKRLTSTMFCDEYIHTVTDSLVGYVRGTEMLNITLPSNIVVPYSTTRIVDLRRIICMLPDLVLSAFRIGEMKGPTLNLTRIRPEMCIVCNRVHTRENAYVFITSKNYVYFKCWRSQGGHLLGTMSVSI